MILPILAILSLIRASLSEAPSAQLTKYLLSETFEGTWKLFESGDQSRVSPWSQLQGKQGTALIYFTKQDKPQIQFQTVSFDLLMPRYIDGRFLKIIIDIRNNFRSQKQSWSEAVNSKYFLYDYSTQIGEGLTPIQFQLDDSLFGVQINRQLFLVVTFSPKYMDPLTSFFFTVLSFVVFLSVKRRNKVSDTNITHQQIPLILSTVMTFLVSACEIAIGFRSLFGKMSPQAFFTVAGIINLAVMYQIVRFYWSILFRNRWSIILVWILSCSYIWFLLFFRHNPLCLIINSLLLLPEIIYHCLRGRKIQSDFRFVFFVFSNQLYVMYFKSCPSNIFKQSPSNLLAYCISSLLLTQSLILGGQVFVGSRFFIPSMLLPSYYNYYDEKKLKAATKANIECHICLQDIKWESQKKRDVMVTPCSHAFHSACLEKWMMVQMRCPVDRSTLPPI